MHAKIFMFLGEVYVSRRVLRTVDCVGYGGTMENLIVSGILGSLLMCLILDSYRDWTVIGYVNIDKPIS
jgi:hypothetical protein